MNIGMAPGQSDVYAEMAVGNVDIGIVVLVDIANKYLIEEECQQTGLPVLEVVERKS